MTMKEKIEEALRGRNLTNAAKELGCTVPELRQAAARVGITLPAKMTTAKPMPAREDVLADIADGLTMRQISAKHRCDYERTRTMVQGDAEMAEEYGRRYHGNRRHPAPVLPTAPRPRLPSTEQLRKDAAHLTRQQIADKYGLTYWWTCKSLKGRGIVPMGDDVRRVMPPLADLLKMRAEGMSYREIGEKYGVTKAAACTRIMRDKRRAK
jgi:hypothetical protein